MESISSFFSLICSFIVNILYENSITNHLFLFDLQKKIIKIKNEEKLSKYKMHDISELKEEQQIDEKSDKLNLNSSKRNPQIRKAINYKATTNESIDTETNFNIKGRAYLPRKNNNNNEINQKNRKKKLNHKLESDKLITFHNLKNKKEFDLIKDAEKNKIENNNNEINNEVNIENISDNNSDSNLINEIHLNKFLVHIAFCCIRNKKNLNNILLDESKNLLSEKLDIINIFKMMCLSEEIKYKFKLDKDVIQMSDECKTSLEYIEF